MTDPSFSARLEFCLESFKTSSKSRSGRGKSMLKREHVKGAKDLIVSGLVEAIEDSGDASAASFKIISHCEEELMRLEFLSLAADRPAVDAATSAVLERYEALKKSRVLPPSRMESRRLCPGLQCVERLRLLMSQIEVGIQERRIKEAIDAFDGLSSAMSSIRVPKKAFEPLNDRFIHLYRLLEANRFVYGSPEVSKSTLCLLDSAAHRVREATVNDHIGLQALIEDAIKVRDGVIVQWLEVGDFPRFERLSDYLTQMRLYVCQQEQDFQIGLELFEQRISEAHAAAGGTGANPLECGLKILIDLVNNLDINALPFKGAVLIGKVRENMRLFIERLGWDHTKAADWLNDHGLPTVVASTVFIESS